MCKGTRHFHICPCASPICARRPSRLNPMGHIHTIEPETTSYLYCDWFYQNHSADTMMGACVQPWCPYFVWNDFRQWVPLCARCQKECPQMGLPEPPPDPAVDEKADMIEINFEDFLK